MLNTYTLLVILVLCWTLNPFMKKKASLNLSSDEYLIFNHTLCSILLVIYLIYLIKYKKCSVKCLNKLTNKEMIFSVFGAITSILSSLVLINLVQNNDISFIIPQIQPIVIVFTVLCGYLFFEENINYTTIVGILMITSGLYIINTGK